MIQENVFDLFSKEYDNWFDTNHVIFETEFNVLKASIGTFSNACEVGVGSGRFAQKLGIETGIEPSKKMSKIAESRGITVYNGYGESIPLLDSSFDLVLMNTVICFLSDIPKTLKEVWRILSPKGRIVVGMIVKNSPLGVEIEKNKANDKFFKNANLRTVEEIIILIKENGFDHLSIKQTLTNIAPQKAEEFSEGYGTGNFIVITAIKKMS
ncbi:MAG: methyltransferase domain-containing protein [Bacteroidia bacterium]|jgi:ubiquinone/menaquinone biosynthesis C-methylase UbiE|nr:methyltransferase domain-containing protein [Bacteroidia bacterium]